MTQFNRTVRTYDQANEYLGLKPRRPIGHNTEITRRDDGAIQVKYHGSPVVTYLPAGQAHGGPVTLLDSCGWKTLTTKERINAFCPAGFRVWQERGTWHLSKGSWQDNVTWTFADGITIDSYGQVFNAGPTNEAQEVKKLVNRIRKYAKHYAQELVDGKLEAPGAGDCWYCSALGGDTSHLLSHLEEDYLVPSLLLRAIESKPVCLFSQDAIGRLWYSDQKEALGKWQKDILTRDVIASITHYFKRQLNLAA